tara:strand:+ start:437 stop:1426 length:990 start_codon:yes stop_codon:yes gene_type:complete
MNVTEEAQRLVEQYGSVRAAARATGIPRTTLRHRLKKKDSSYQVEELPPSDLPVEHIVDHLHSRFKQKKANKESKKWIKIKMESNQPIGLLWFGDPHIDDSHCDWDALRDHLDVVNSSDSIYGCSLGDYSNNWVGRLGRLYGEQETSAKTAWKLVEWFVNEMNPMILIGGNHDMWSGAGDPLNWIAQPHTVLEDWEARIQLDFPNGRFCRIHAAHDMPGHSQFNALHAQGKMAKLKGSADLYISGHRHNWGLSHIELVEQEKTAWLARARGYKYFDNYAFVKGFEQQKFGQSIMQVIDPQNKSEVSWNQCFADPHEGADYLRFRQSLQQ